MEPKEHWIFYLKLNKDLPREYLALDTEFKKHGKSLIPITLSTLLETTKSKKSIYVLIVVRNSTELKYFQAKIKKVMKYFMKTERVHLYIASSFQTINDPSIMKKDYYNFVRLPVQIEEFCGKVAKNIEIQEGQVFTWPGGKSPRMSLAG